jgi:hypothetical protein
VRGFDRGRGAVGGGAGEGGRGGERGALDGAAIGVCRAGVRWEEQGGCLAAPPGCHPPL